MTPDDLVGLGSSDYLRRNGIPDASDASDRRRAAQRIREVLGGRLLDDGVHGSTLGTEWTTVFTAVVSERPSDAELTAAGWLPLRPLLGRLRLPLEDRWAVTDDSGRVLAAVTFRAQTRRMAVDDVLDRARARGEVRLADVLELQELRRAGHPFPDASPVLTAAADIETALGQRELVRWASGRRVAAPRAVGHGRVQRFVVAVSGVDGAGKSTVLEGLQRDLDRCGLPVGRVWLRPGMGLGRLTGLARRVKRSRGLDEEPGVNRVAADPDADLSSRRGPVGWVWSMTVAVSFVAGVRRQHAAARGVVLYDRHLLDALVTLDFLYGGADLRVQQWLVRLATPRADVSLHLDVSVDEAVRRKPGDQIGRRAVDRQVAGYQRWLGRLPGTRLLDAARDVDVVVAEAVRRVLGDGARSARG